MGVAGLEPATSALQGRWKRVRDAFEAGKWNRALRLIEKSYGPLDPMLTETGEEVWAVWKRVVVRYRGDIVHGIIDPSANEAEQATATGPTPEPIAIAQRSLGRRAVLEPIWDTRFRGACV